MLRNVSKKGLLLMMIAFLMVGVLAGCGKGEEQKPAADASKQAATPAPAKEEKKAEPAKTDVSGTVTASGSTALLPLVKQAADDFMQKNSKVTINVTGGGSGTGVKQVAAGEVNIGNSDVAADDKSLVDHIVCIAPFALIVNKDVNVDSLTKQQAADIYMGKITNWKDVGGPDKKITLVHRPEGSGSRKLVQQIVLDGKDFSKEGVVQESSGALKTAVEGTSGAIGYVDTPYVDDKVKAVKFEGVAFSDQAIKDGKYPLYGVEHMYTKGEPTGAVKAFLDYIMSDDFQNKRVKELKFLPANLLKK